MDPILRALFESIVFKLRILMGNKFPLTEDAIQALEKLDATLNTFQQMSQAEEGKESKSAVVIHWLNRIKYVANDADRNLEKILNSFEQQMSQAEEGKESISEWLFMLKLVANDADRFLRKTLNSSQQMSQAEEGKESISAAVRDCLDMVKDVANDGYRVLETLNKFEQPSQAEEGKESKSAVVRDWLNRLKYVANRVLDMLNATLMEWKESESAVFRNWFGTLKNVANDIACEADRALEKFDATLTSSQQMPQVDFDREQILSITEKLDSIANDKSRLALAEVGLAVLPSLSETIFSKFQSLTSYDFSLLEGDVKEDLEKLHATLNKFKNELQKLEVMESKSATTIDWYHRLKYVADEADRILDSLKYTDDFNFNHADFNHKLGKRIKSVMQKLDLLDVEKNMLDLEPVDINQYPETSSTSSQTRVFGRKEANTTWPESEVGLAVLPSLFETIFSKLQSLTGNEFRLLEGGLKEDLEKLDATLNKLKHELQKVEVMEFKSATTIDWYHRLKYVADEADGILDSLIYDDHKERVCYPFPPHFDFDLVVGEKIKSVMQKLDLLDVEKNMLDLEPIGINQYGDTSSTASETQVFGRIEGEEKIINILLNHEKIVTDVPPFIYAIVGMPGSGKSALARSIHDDAQVVEKFDARIWVWVLDFNYFRVMEKIKGCSRKYYTFESLESMHYHLKQLLNKKFLLVLNLDDQIDDVVLGEWDELKSLLKCGATGSSILLTTREFGGVPIAVSHGLHYVTILSEDQCWHVFKESAFFVGNSENGELEMIGKQIVKNCRGVPFAAKTLGASLRLTQEVSDWESVRDSSFWRILGVHDIFPVFRVSSERLESHLRNCFAFCSIFPKGYAINKEHLIHLWMANDLVPFRQGVEQEDMGNKICNELVLKSFFEISQDCIKLPDLMHDLSHTIWCDCFCLEGPDVSNIPPEILHLSIKNPYHSTKNNILLTLSKSHPSLLACILVNEESRQNFPTAKIIFKDLDSLRALDLSHTIMSNLPASISKMEHLKYLNLKWTDLTHVPDSICTLTKLQTLKLGGCRRLTHLPDGIAKLTNLRHLDLRGCENLTHLPVGISQMTNLRHLDICFCSELAQLPNGMGQLVYLRMLGLFIVGRESGQRITELQGLKHLRGRLEIRGLEHVRDAREAEEANLKEKNISSLSLIWGYLQESNDEAEVVLQALQPPQSLKGELVITGYGGSVFASWMQLLENLVRLELQDCVKCELLPPLGQLSNLKVLTIVGLKSLKSIGPEFYDSNSGSSSNDKRRKIFPSLEKLKFEDMPILEEWHATEVEDGLPACPCLKMLELLKCPMLTVLPSGNLFSVQKLVIHDCDKVMVISLSGLTSLELHGFGTNNVTSFPDGSLQNLDALEFLKIKCYSELTSLPVGISNLSSLRTLDIESCPALRLLPVIGDSLVKMHVHECHHLKSLSLSLQNLSTLESLTVSSCDQLVFSSKDFQNLLSLQTLRVDSLPNCTSFPSLQNLSTLQSLSITYCKNLRLGQQAMQMLTVLEKLTLCNCEQLDLPSRYFQHLSNLRSITLCGLPKLTSLPELQHIHSLETLTIRECKNLKIPSQQMQNLTSLQALWIGASTFHQYPS